MMVHTKRRWLIQPSRSMSTYSQLPTTKVVGLCAVGPTPQRQFNCRCSSSAIRERGCLSRFGVVSPRRKGRLTTTPSMKKPHMVSSRATVLTLFCPHGSVNNCEGQTLNFAVGLPPTTKVVGFRPRNQCELRRDVPVRSRRSLTGCDSSSSNRGGRFARHVRSSQKRAGRDLNTRPTD